MTRIALATSRDLPALWHDDLPLVSALRERGADVTPAVWDEPAVDWSSYDLVIVRSTWDYTWRRDEFVGWAERVEKAVPLRNPARIVRWNTDKTYLRDLAGRGVPIVATEWLDGPADLAALLESRGWSEAVLKPAVSAGARDTMRFSAATADEAADLLGRITEASCAMVQPYLLSVEGPGRALAVLLRGRVLARRLP